MTTQVVYDKSIDYSQKVSSSPIYKYTKILQQTGGGSAPLSLNSSSEAIFDIPSSVLNFSKSFIRFVLYQPAAQIAGAGDNSNSFMTGIPPIRRVSLYTRNGQYLLDINNFQMHWKMCKNLVTKLDEFQAYPSHGESSTIEVAKRSGLCIFNNPSNNTTFLPSDNSAIPVAAHVSHAGKINNALALDMGTTERRGFQTESVYSTAGLDNAGGGGGNSFLNCELRFGKIPFSIFSVDKDLYFSEILQLRIEFEQTSNFAFKHTAVTTLAGPSNPAGVTLTELALYLALEGNESIKQSIMQKVLTEGMNLLIPYPYLYRISIGTNASASVSQRINAGMGQRLLRIISAPSLTADSLTSRCNLYNHAGVKHTDFFTTIDSQRVEPENLNASLGDDYKYNYRYIKQTGLAVQQEYYTESPIHINDFSGCDSLLESKDKDLTVCGLPLTQEVLFGKVYNTKATSDQTENVVVVCQRTLSSTGQGVMVV